MARRRVATRSRTIARVIANPRKGRRSAPRVLSNPRRRKAKSRKSRRSKARRSKARRNPRRSRASRRSRRSNPRRSRRSMKRRNPRRGKVSVKAHRRSRPKRRSSKRRNPYTLSSRSRSGWTRTNPRRRNPGGQFTGGIARMLAKIPLIGGPLAIAAVNIPAGILAGVSVEVPLRLSPMAAQQTWIPEFIRSNEWIYFTTLGAVSGGVIATGLSAAKIKLPFGFTPGHIAGLMTAAASGAGYAKMRTRQMANEIGIATPEQQVAGDDAVAGLGALVANGTSMGALTADMGMGPAYSVAPGGYGGPMHAVMVSG